MTHADFDRLDLPPSHHDVDFENSTMYVRFSCDHVVEYDVTETHVSAVQALVNLRTTPCVRCTAELLSRAHPALQCSPRPLIPEVGRDLTTAEAHRLKAIVAITRMVATDRGRSYLPYLERKPMFAGAWFRLLGKLLEAPDVTLWGQINLVGTATTLHQLTHYYAMRRDRDNKDRSRFEMGDLLLVLMHLQLRQIKDDQLYWRE